MNWPRILIAGGVAGIVGWLVDFGLHGFVLGPTYTKLDTIFTQEQANPLSFLALSLAAWIVIAYLFAKTRDAWPPGAKGGACLGLWAGVLALIAGLYDPLVLLDFPTSLSWYQGGVALLNGLVAGAVMGALNKP